MQKPLNRATASLPQNKPVKVLQFGKGNFLRAFADWMIDILNEKAGFNGAVQIVQVNSVDDDKRFAQQDGLYHVVINGIRNGKAVRETRLISAVDRVINPFTEYDEFLKAGENPHLQFILSNTTEAGIAFDVTDERAEVPAKTFPGKLTALLYHRFKFFDGDPSKAPVLLPCELIERNGEILRDTMLRYIAHWNLPESFGKWIAEHAGFCNSLVDRIVPGFPKDKIDEVWKETGYRDDLVVSAEPYHLWVIEPVDSKNFTVEKIASMLPFDRAGLRVKFTDNLAPYRTSKVRILNGAHTTMVPVAWLRGLRTVKDAIDDPVTGGFVREALEKEIIPTLGLPAAELEQFAADVIDRFRNPYIRHELSAIALNSISKFQVRVLPSILAYHKRRGELPKRLLHAFAALIVFYKGVWKGQPTPVKDTQEVVAFFKESWRQEDVGKVVRAVLSNQDLWKTDLTRIEGLAEEVERNILSIQDLK